MPLKKSFSISFIYQVASCLKVHSKHPICLEIPTEDVS